MASTTFRAVRDAVAVLIKGLTPLYKASIKFKETKDDNILGEESSVGKFRYFQVESGGLSLFQSVFATDLSRDSKKEMIVSVIYPQLDNNDVVRDMADEDENLIIRELQHPDNRPTGVLQFTLNNTSHEIDDGFRQVDYSFLVHYNHE